MKYKFHDIQQNTDEWFELRTGKLTTSNLGKIMANIDKPTWGEPAKRYAHRIAKEQITGEREEEESFTNKYMEAGHEWEPVAVQEYEFDTFNDVSNGGFCESLDIPHFGGSPDGLVSFDNGGIEVKSVISWTHRNTIKSGSFDRKYKWQILGNMLLCNLDWMDFISFGYTYTTDKRLYVHRLHRKDYQKELDMIVPRIGQFLKLIEEEKKYL